MFTIHVFGMTSVRSPERMLQLTDLPGGKPRQVLEIVALARGAVVSKPVLADLLWAGHPPPRAIATLETYVAVLRRCLQPGTAGRDTIVGTIAGGYRLDPLRVRLDLDDFDELAAAAHRAAPVDAVTLWQRAADLAQRVVLEHEPHAEWAHATRVDYVRQSLQAAVRGAEAALDAGLLDDAIALARRATRQDPLAEDGWQALIEAQGRAGRPAEAARAAATCLEALARHLGVYPSPRTHRLLRTALTGDFAPRTARPVAAAAR